jgi:hypothetical protein
MLITKVLSILVTVRRRCQKLWAQKDRPFRVIYSYPEKQTREVKLLLKQTQ